MGYGSGTAEFPYLVSPAEAILAQAGRDNTTVHLNATASNWDLAEARRLASNAEVAIVCVAATAGEGYVTVEGNAGDRNNLTLWGNGDRLVAAVAAVNPHTVVVLHTPGPVLLGEIDKNPNVSAILWAGFPGQESGNGLVDVLYGRVSPQGRSPFTWGETEESYGEGLLMDKAEDPRRPVQVFGEGVWVDYRWFGRTGKGVVYPFGFGLRYTEFWYANLTVVRHAGFRGEYPPAKGMTGAAPTYGVVERELASHVVPDGFARTSPYVYPWLNNSEAFVTSVGNSSQFPGAARDGSAQPVLSASGAPGGNPGLYEVLYTITASIRNIGQVKGTEIPQLVGRLNHPF
jgi:beta-glucosidase